MDDDIKAEIERLQAYAVASEQDFEEVAAQTIVQYQKALKVTRGALADAMERIHYETYPLAPVPE